METKAAQSRGGGADENIKSKSVENNPKALPEAPPEKGGDKSRGGNVCHLLVDNYTRYKIQIFVDGDYVGLVSPWGDAKGSYIPNGFYTFYGVADFTDGSRLIWGPTRDYCEDYYWKLTP